MKNSGPITVYTKHEKTEHHNYQYYFHKALERILYVKTKKYQSITEIEVIHGSVLLVNWPEEILDWSVSESAAQEAIRHLKDLKKDGLKIFYIWHNTRAHHNTEGKSKLYEWFQQNSSFILCLNSRTLKHCKHYEVKCAMSLHPFMYNNFPAVRDEGLLIYGRLRHRSEYLKLLVATWTAHIYNREVFVGSLPAVNARGIFTKLVINFLPNAPNIHLHVGFLNGAVEHSFWKKSKTVVTFRNAKHENSGVLINALSEKRSIIIGNCGSAGDYENLKAVSVFGNIIEMIQAIIKDSKTAYESEQFEEQDYIDIKAQSSSSKFAKALENGLSQIYNSKEE